MTRLPRFFCGATIATLSAFASAASASPKELGYNVHQSTDVGMDATKAAGLGWVRVDFNWLDAEPTVQGTYDWTRFDAIVAAADARGLKVLAVLGYTPVWASQGDTKTDGSTNDIPKAGTYAPFVTAAVNRYKAKVTHYEIWNEPNLEQFFEGQPQDYIDRIFVPGADAVHAACPTCKVMGPGLATVGTAYATWLDAVLTQAGAKLDIVSGHIYNSFPEPGGGAGTTSDSFFNKLESHRVVKLGGATIYEGPLSFKEVMDKHASNKPFWLTETGKEATFGSAAEEEAQRLYTRRVLDVMVNRPWWTTTIFYEAFDEPPAPYHWGAVVHDPAAPGGYKSKSVQAFLQKVTSSQPLFGGTKTDCDDGLDNDLDGTVDFPADQTCTSLAAQSEGIAPAPDPDAGTVGTSSGDPGSSGSDGTSGGDGGSSGESAAPGSSDEGGCQVSREGAPVSSLLGTAFAALIALGSIASRRLLR
jgi:hypothetical protein